jgi:hypothetical protein
MTVRGRRLSHLQSIAVAMAVCLIACLATIAFARTQARAYGDPAVIVLGSGNDLSILITDGPAPVRRGASEKNQHIYAGK